MPTKHQRRLKLTAAIEKNRPNVKVGQVWRDWDVRYRGISMQLLTVMEIGDTHVVALRDNGIRVKIRIDRFRPTATGYKLITDAV